MAAILPEPQTAGGQSGACPGSDSPDSCQPGERQQRLLRARDELTKAALDAEARLASAEELGRVGQRLLSQVLETLALLSSAATAKREEMRAVLAGFTAEAAAELAALRSALDHGGSDDELLLLAETTAASAAATPVRRTLQLHADNKELDMLLGLARALDRIQLVVAAPDDADSGGLPAEQGCQSCVDVKKALPRVATKPMATASRVALPLVLLLLVVLGCSVAVTCALLLAPDELNSWLTAAAANLLTWPPQLHAQIAAAWDYFLIE